MRIPFRKMNGLGNDFVVFDARHTPLALTEVAAKRIADRRLGIGCDQVIVVEKGRDGADAFMRIWNADGGEVETCGNAARCVAQVLMDESGKDSAILMAKAGKQACARADGGAIAADMGEPKFDWQDIPLAERMDTRNIDIKLGPIDAPVLFGPAAVNVGNPHCIFFVKSAAAHNLEKLGPLVENHPLFPERANVSLAEVVDTALIRLRVWERGVGITSACGTAACAALAAAARKKLTGRKAQVVLDGGMLEIEWRESDNHLLMTGPAALNFTGEIESTDYGIA